MNIEHISVSRKQVWDQCKCLYKYKYHLKLNSPEPEPFYFVYGKVIHKIAEEYVSRKGERTLSEVTLDVLEQRIPIERGENEVFAPKIPEEYRRRMPEHLRSIKYITEQMGNEGYLEFPFYYDLEPPNGLFIKGFIDRLIERDGNWFILDYKTTKRGRWRKDRQSILHDLQLRMYARIVQKKFDVSADKIRCALYYLEGGNLIAAQYTQDALDGAEAELLQAYKEIQVADPNKVIGNVADHCNRCDYRSICPFFNRSTPYEF